ncbi:Gti1/Pac2 family-domain-containing protein [Mycena albidolilacea]|uniref:Gti1/Pac2 family-domain-containing protein n=1 Tax=Mycena albidolilacea TaxID=1033008 RepID=A0AAD6ZGJ4_9AGAR|nr:Gti1/Pac2 family-domain-containing protein [Mycena albidolilacea]
MLQSFDSPVCALIYGKRTQPVGSTSNMHQSAASLNVTHPALHIRNASDVLVVLEAVRRGILPLITLRLSGSERDQLRSGNVFVWEESIEEGGLVRWTDGRKWSKSKVCAECLIYQEKVEVTEEEKQAKAMRRMQRICNPRAHMPPPRRNTWPLKSGGLTKQTYSFLFRVPGSCETRKWHVVAYTLWPHRLNLPVIEDYPVLRTIHVPTGVFARSKASDIVTTHLSPHIAAQDQNGLSGEGRADRSGPFRIVLLSTFADHLPAFGSKLPLFDPGRDDGTDLVLPPISWLKQPWGSSPVCTVPEAALYFRDSVCQEDRRILDSFRLSF